MEYNKVYDINMILYNRKHKLRKIFLKYYKNIFEISKSNEYNELLIEYKEFIADICKFIKDLNIDNPLEIICLLTKLLYDGYFSKDFNVDFNDNTSVDVLNLTWGSKICTGNFVCRHLSVFFDDILKGLNIESELVDIIAVSKLNIKMNCFTNTNEYFSNHLAVGLKYNNELYIYDPMNYMFLIKDLNEYKNNKDNDDMLNLIGLTWDLDPINDLKYLYRKNNIYGNFDYNNLKEFNVHDLKVINDIDKKTNTFINNNIDLFDKFHINNSKKIRTLAYKNNELLDKQSIY